MREIIFRGQRVDSKEWVYGDLITYTDNRFGIISHAPIPLNFEALVNDELCREVIPKTVGQFIDLKDKNGKKIYKGDILKDRNGRIGEVIFAYGSYWFYPFEMVLVSDMNVLCEIIGDIYDNPELLATSKCKPWDGFSPL